MKMKKSFQDQLSEYAKSHGFDAKKECNEATQKQPSRNKLMQKGIIKKLQSVIKLAHAGRNGKQFKVAKTFDISAFLTFIIECKQKGELSETDAYFCLCAVANIEEFSTIEINEFQNVFCNVNSRITELINLNKLSKKDVEAYSRQSKLRKIQQEKIQKQNNLEHFIFLAKKVLFSGIDLDAKIAATPTFNEEDLKLSIEWAQDKQLQKDAKNFSRIALVIEKYEKDPELSRVMSARAAEKAVKSFYEKCNFTVEDVSIRQIGTENVDWKLYDLNVNNYPVDVKNSRRALASSDRYVEHCVPNFKSIRNDVNVKIAGILSQYLWPKTIFEPDNYPNHDTSLLFLGETTYAVIEKLRHEYMNQYLDIDFGRPERGANFFLPPWIFNYSPDLYRKRDVAISDLRRQLAPDYILCKEKNFNCIPSCLAANINLLEYYPPDALKKWEWDLYNKMLRRFQEHGLSLPFVYLSLLSHFTEMLSKYSDQCKDYKPYCYRRFVFMNNDELNKPLGIYDPLYTVRSLIDVLDELWSANHDLIRLYKYFRLSGFHIFQGKRSPGDSWETLIAYCGGWIEGKGKCGKYPLVLGESNRCGKCKKLICPVCGFCSEGCENYYAKKIAQNDYHRSAENKKSFCDEVPF